MILLEILSQNGKMNKFTFPLIVIQYLIQFAFVVKKIQTLLACNIIFIIFLKDSISQRVTVTGLLFDLYFISFTGDSIKSPGWNKKQMQKRLREGFNKSTAQTDWQCWLGTWLIRMEMHVCVWYSSIKCSMIFKQALRNSCELLRQRKELDVSSCNCMQARGTACKLI